MRRPTSLFTGVRGRGVLRSWTSVFTHSRKFLISNFVRWRTHIYGYQEYGATVTSDGAGLSLASPL
jgi:hypothetical protein